MESTITTCDCHFRWRWVHASLFHLATCCVMTVTLYRARQSTSPCHTWSIPLFLPRIIILGTDEYIRHHFMQWPACGRIVGCIELYSNFLCAALDKFRHAYLQLLFPVRIDTFSFISSNDLLWQDGSAVSSPTVDIFMPYLLDCTMLTY